MILLRKDNTELTFENFSQASQNREDFIELAGKAQLVLPQIDAIRLKLRALNQDHVANALSNLYMCAQAIKDLIILRGRPRKNILLDAIKGRASKVSAEIQGAQQNLMGAMSFVVLSLQIEAVSGVEELQQKVDKMNMEEESDSARFEKTHPWELMMKDIAYTTTRRGGPTDDIVLGSGGFGKVFRAAMTIDGEKILVAVKEPHDASEIHKNSSLRRQFYRELYSLLRMNHKNVVRLFGAIVLDEGDSCYMIVTELLKTPLDKYLTTIAVSDVERMMVICRDISDGLAYLHSSRVLHRDIKPPNIMMSDDGSFKFIDFGLSQIQENSKATKSTTRIAGTEDYMSPEKTRGVEILFSKVSSLVLLRRKDDRILMFENFSGIINTSL